MDSELRTQAQRHSNSASAEDQNLDNAIETARKALHRQFAAENSTAAQRLKAADAAWARYVRLRTAGASTALQGEEGLFSPTQLQSSVQRNDKSYQRTAFSEGDSLMQDLSHAGKQVIPSKLANSGTADRIGIPALTAATAAEPTFGMAATGALSAGALAYAQRGQAMLKALAARGQDWRQPMGEAVRSYGPSALIRAIASQLGTPLQQPRR